MRTDSVTIAFEMILEEIDSVVTEVNSQGAALLQNNDYSLAKGVPPVNLLELRFR